MSGSGRIGFFRRTTRGNAALAGTGLPYSSSVPLLLLLLLADPCPRTDVVRGPITIATSLCEMQSGIAPGYLTLRCDRRGSPLPVAISAGSAFVDEAGLWVDIVVENRSRRTIRVPRRNGVERYWIAEVNGHPRTSEPSRWCIDVDELAAIEKQEVVEIAPKTAKSLGLQLLVPWYQLWCDPADAEEVTFRLDYRLPLAVTVQYADTGDEARLSGMRRQLDRTAKARCRLYGHDITAAAEAKAGLR